MVLGPTAPFFTWSCKCEHNSEESPMLPPTPDLCPHI